MPDNAAFQWKCEPQAENLILAILKECSRCNPFLMHLDSDLHKHTSTRLFDWIDHVVVGSSKQMDKDLHSGGFVAENAAPSYRVFFHPGAQLPRVVVKDHDQSVVGVAISVESIADFLMVRGMTASIEGAPLSGYRKARVSIENEVSVWVIERRGTLTMEPTYPVEDYQKTYLAAVEKWQVRPKTADNDVEEMTRTLLVAQEIVNSVSEDLAAWIVLECERKYWQARNSAGAIQKNRQDRLGMGWANHDHHTFRSSRSTFFLLVRLFESLGFHCRERYYTGKEAGWGAQIMENSRAKLILFLDVDLSADEIAVDFAHQPLPDLDHLGTIGLWTALHGDSILKGGMHHLEAQFMFEELTRDLKKHGQGVMAPFSDFPYLKQAFTEGEVWAVDPVRVNKLAAGGKITKEQADKFLAYGAVGSHLENLQRREGYKGFNQKNVSVIIKKTDPRKMLKGVDG